MNAGIFNNSISISYNFSCLYVYSNNVDENVGQFEEDIIKIRLGIESVEEEKN